MFKKSAIGLSFALASTLAFAQGGSGSAQGSAQDDENNAGGGLSLPLPSGGSSDGASSVTENSPVNFSTLDLDTNGVLSREELQHHPSINFGSLDTDGNGTLSNSEFSAFETNSERGGGSASGRAGNTRGSASGSASDDGASASGRTESENDRNNRNNRNRNNGRNNSGSGR